MLYASVADLQGRYGDLLSQILGRVDPESNDQVTAALEDATAEVDGFLQGRYTLPLQPVPRMITQLTVDIVIYRLLPLRPEVTSEDARGRYKDARATLTAIRDGRMDLGSTLAQVLPKGPGMVQVTSQPRLFRRDRLRDA
jgi:phage gp36-like protein